MSPPRRSRACRSAEVLRSRWSTRPTPHKSPPCCGVLGRRSRDRLHCTRCGVVWQADHAAAINVLHRVGDPDITPGTPHQRVKSIVQERADRRPDQTADPGLQPTGGERTIQLKINVDQ
ncbi:zinc ribbon domain-containing protein [Saccharopolyspora sp. 5N102]|uniref:zinc ribbon domain-containing protein n=1 Tax=Saccharopolyspora sp. 5N102 TaxID=3375155 RepID=UPI0037A327C2